MLLAILLPLLSVSFIYASSKMLAVLCMFIDENYGKKDHENEELNKINNFDSPIRFLVGLCISVSLGLMSTFICSFNPDRFIINN